MAYQPLTLSKFKHLLEAGQYQSATGARRAIGKAAAFSAADKAAANKLIDKTWAGEAVAAPKPAAKKANMPASKPAKAPQGAKAAPAPQAAPKKMGRPKGSQNKLAGENRKVEVLSAVEQVGATLQPMPSVALLIGERIVASGTMALTASNSFGPSGQTVGKEAVALIGRGVQLLRDFVDEEISARTPSLTKDAVAPKSSPASKKAEPKSPLNGAAASELNGQQVFEGTIPT